MKKFKLLSVFTLAILVMALVAGVADTTFASSASKAKDVMDKLPTEPININSADLETLMTLPGIGEKRAKDILEFRKTLGGKFENIDQIKEVSGIGEGVFEKIKKFIEVK